VRKSGLAVWACAILPDHVHLVIGRAAMPVERVVIQLKGAATEQLVAEGLHPFGDMRDARGRVPKCFARGEWTVFLDPPDVPRAVGYTEENPLKEGKSRQRWVFVQAPPMDFGPAVALRSAKPSRRG
jgi:REP element-mobilizing transposase RayT